MKRQTRIVAAQGDDGRQYTLYIYTGIAPAGTRTAPRTGMAGHVELATSDGQLVRWRAKGVYEVVVTGVVLRCSAPDAP